MKKRLPIIIIAVFVVVFAGLGFYSHQKNKIKYNTSYVNGNTAGNLYNAGLFCEKNGTVYFANPDDDYRLYSMDTNGNHLKKLSYDRVMYINADDHYVYYVRNNENNGTGFDFFSYARNSLCRIDQNGENTKILDKDPCLYASLVGNYIYYLHYDDKDATTLYKIGIDGEGRKKVYSPYIFTCSTLGQYIYTSGTESDGAIYQLDTASDSLSKVYECNSFKPIVTSDDNVYYMDVDLYHYYLGREDQSVNEKVLMKRIDQQIYVTRLVSQCANLDEVAKKHPKLAVYMRRNISIMMAISSIHLLLINTPEAYQKRKQLWQDIRKRNAALYYQLKYRTLSGLTYLPGKVGGKLTIGGYRLANRIYKFQ